MVQAWYYDETCSLSPQHPHQFTPNKPVNLKELTEIGIFYKYIDCKNPNYMDEVEALCKERGYKNRDQMGNVYDDKIKMFLAEHLHEDEEIRLVIEGTGYFDVRSKDDRWIRICVQQSDLVILPAGIFHRFTVDEKDFIVAIRLFSEEPKWTPINRTGEIEKSESHQTYRKTIEH